MNKKFNYDNNQSNPEVILAPVIQKPEKLANRRLWRPVGALAIAISVPTALVAMADSPSNESNMIVAATDSTQPVDTLNDTTTTLPVETTTTLLDTTTTLLVTDTTDLGSGGGSINTDPTISPDTTDLPTTTPETTMPPLQGLNVSFYENDADNLIYPGDVVTYTINFENIDLVEKNISVLAGFIDSFAISQIVDLRINGCLGYSDSSSFHIDVSNIQLQPEGACTIEYDVKIAFPDRTAHSYAQIYDNTANKSYNLGSDVLYS